MPKEELWTEVRDIVQEAVIKTIPKKRKCKKEEWLPEEALQIAEKRRETKGKGEKERYTHLNAEFQRIVWRDNAFLSDQCKEIEENYRMEKTRDFFNKIRWRRKWQPTTVFLPGESHGQRCLAGNSPWGRKSRTWLSDLKKKLEIPREDFMQRWAQ